MDLSDLQKAIAAAADDLAQLAPSVGNKGKAYEIWIALELAVRLLRLGYDVEAHDPAGVEVVVFRARGAPGGMSSANAVGDDNPSHFRVSGWGRALEIHLGLQVLGVSDSRHEIDVTVLPASVAEDLRDAGGGPYQGPLAVGLELKAYDEKHKLNQVFPRALLGVAVDVHPIWLFPAISMGTAGGAEHRRQLSRRALIGLLTSTELYDNSRDLLDGHGMLAGDQVRPGADEFHIDRVVNEIIRELGPHRRRGRGRMRSPRRPEATRRT